MALRQVPGTGIKVHPFAIDGGVFGWASGVEQTSRILDAFAEGGGNLISTADHYAGGRSEIMIGSWLKTLPDRGRAIIATKIGKHPDAAGLGRRAVVRAVEASLNRLGTDYIDFVALDGEDPTTPVDETLEVIDQLRRAGKIRYLSVSDYSGARVRAINELAGQAVYPPIRAVTCVYNLMQRTAFESDLAPVAHDLGIGILARQPLASGFLFGSFRARSEEPGSPFLADALKHVGKRGTRVLEAMEAVAAEQGESVGRAALAWVLSKPGVVAAAIRVKSADQLVDLQGEGEQLLTRHQMGVLNKASE